MRPGFAVGGRQRGFIVANNDLFKVDNKMLLSVYAKEAHVADTAITLPIFESPVRDRFIAEVEVPAEHANEVVLSGDSTNTCQDTRP
jgi:hypothetical protein